MQSTPTGQTAPTNTPSAPLIKGYAFGALILTFFGSLWASISTLSLNLLPTVLDFVIVVAVTLSLAYAAFTVLGAAAALPAAAQLGDSKRGKTLSTWFGVIFGIEFATIFLASILLSQANKDQYIPLTIALIVGLHLLPLATLFKVRIYYLTGGIISLLAAIAIVSLISGVTLGADYAWSTIVGASTALILWLTALYLVITSQRMLTSTIPTTPKP